MCNVKNVFLEKEIFSGKEKTWKFARGVLRVLTMLEHVFLMISNLASPRSRPSEKRVLTYIYKVHVYS